MDWITQNWELVAAIAVAVISEVLPLVDGTKYNGIVHLILDVLKRVSGKGVAAVLCLFMLAGCTTLNVSLNTSNGDTSKGGAIKTDADAKQDISPNTTATIPLR